MTRRPTPPRALDELARCVEMGNQALAQNRLCEAERLYRQVIAHAPAIPEAHNNLGTVLKEQGRLLEAHQCFEKALRLRPTYTGAHSNLLFTLQYAPGQTLAGLRQAHEAWARVQLACIRPKAPTDFPARNPGPLVVGLVSPDLYYHPVGVFLLPWLQNRNCTDFRFIAYSDGAKEDGMTQRIRTLVGLWRPIAGLGDDAVAKQIAADGVDILIDLAGHTAGNRLKLFARRAAPIQVSWLGYSATTGLPAMDCMLMDAYTAPLGCEAHFTEKLLIIDGLRFCYAPPEYAPAVTSAPVLRNGFVTFGSFNNLAKITPEVIETWAAILNAVPDARLVLKWKSLGAPETSDRLKRQFSQHGIGAERIACRGWSNHPAMLAEYGDIDIALDSFPFSGCLTSCDALYMGVPIVTLAGKLPIGRQSASFLSALGLDDMIAQESEEYTAKAVALARDKDRLALLRQTMRPRMLASRLCDGPAYARAIENALVTMVA